MSTRSNIAILLRPEDRNKDFKTPWGQVVNANGKKYLYVYCHNDGYPEGVGEDLIRMFDGDKYEKALRYILMGDRSTTDLSYWEWRKEQCAPRAADTEEEMYQNDYLYVIEEVDVTMQVRLYGDDDDDWNDDEEDEDEGEGEEDAYYLSINKEPDGSFRVKQYSNKEDFNEDDLINDIVHE